MFRILINMHPAASSVFGTLMEMEKVRTNNVIEATTSTDSILHHHHRSQRPDGEYPFPKRPFIRIAAFVSLTILIFLHYDEHPYSTIKRGERFQIEDRGIEDV